MDAPVAPDRHPSELAMVQLPSPQVRVEQGVLRVQRATTSDELLVGLMVPILAFGGVGVVSVLLVLALDVLGGSLLWALPLIVLLGLVAAVAVVGGLGMVVWATNPGWIEVGPDGVHTGGLLGRRIARPTAVHLRGEVGRAIEVSVGGRWPIRLVRGVPSLSGNTWTYEQLLALAHRVALQLGVEVRDELDHVGWERWLGDPSERNRVAYEHQHAASLKRFARWHQVEPAEPRRVAYDHHGLKAYGMVIDGHELRRGYQRIALDEVIEVRSAFMSRSRKSVTVAVLLLRTRDRVLPFGGTDVSRQVAAGYHWLADKLTDQLLLGSTSDEGSVADVPPALVELHRKAKAPTGNG